MSELLFKNFELTRSYFLNTIAGLEEGISEVQPDGFNNNIHWHIGHVLTTAEQFMFGFPKKSSNLPDSYLALFGSGTKPVDWQGEVPAVSQLTLQLKEQLTRIKEIPVESFSAKLKTPFKGLETFGEISNFALMHEALHMGKIQAMKSAITVAQVK